MQSFLILSDCGRQICQELTVFLEDFNLTLVDAKKHVFV